MLTYSKYATICFTLLCLPVLVSAQNCNVKLSGYTKDASTGEPISFAIVYSPDNQVSTVTDSLGYFELNSICPGGYHLAVSHIGCETVEWFFDIAQDTIITVLLDHNSRLLNEMAVIGKAEKITLQEMESLNSASIAQNSDKDLSEMLENLSGVSTIKNGSGISKPVIHGMYGNRISILNNGIAQSGQQWGVDHSPEIDPLVANKITVIKGVGALEYPGNSLGGIILVEPGTIDEDPHLHGEARYVFESNGLGNGLNLELQQHTDWAAWRLVGTVKKNGDYSTPDYYLRNTGSQEANVALQLAKSWNSRWSSELYFSSFNAELGILRGSQIGNLTDLESAFGRDIPFFTEPHFSYSIDAPSQRVNHHLLKLQTEYKISSSQQIDLTYAGQYNLRKEYDVRRSGRSEIPAMSLQQYSQFFQIKYKALINNQWELKSGFQVNQIDNTNIPETGILPLIPDYIAHEYGFFGTLKGRYAKTTVELGARYDAEIRKVAAISFTVPREVLRYENDYHNASFMAGLTHSINDHWNVTYNLGYAVRNPEVNELYSNGLHQGISGIEEGDPNLEAESSIKNTLSLTGQLGSKFFVEGLFYYQHIHDYVFLNPQDEIRLTIRGAFPVFKYEQTNANISGFDVAGTYLITERFQLTGKYSFLYGQDRSNDIPLVFMPSNNLFATLNYQVPEFGSFQNLEFQVNGRYVFEQTHLLPSQDFVAPPPSYYLMGINVSAERQLKLMRLKMFVRIENLLNTTYRDYLNRQRYFADDLGFNMTIGFNLSF